MSQNILKLKKNMKKIWHKNVSKKSGKLNKNCLSKKCFIFYVRPRIVSRTFSDF